MADKCTIGVMNDVEMGEVSKPIQTEVKERDESEKIKALFVLGKSWREGRDRGTENDLSVDARLTAKAAGELGTAGELGEPEFNMMIFMGGMERKRVEQVWGEPDEKYIKELKKQSKKHDIEITIPDEVVKLKAVGGSTMSEAEAMFRYALRTTPELFGKVGKVYVRGADREIVEQNPLDFISPLHLKRLAEDTGESEEKYREDYKPKEAGIEIYLAEEALNTRAGAVEAKEILKEVSGTEDMEEVMGRIHEDSAVLTVGFHLKRSERDFANEGFEIESMASDDFLAGMLERGGKEGNPHMVKLQKQRKWLSPRIYAERGREAFMRGMQAVDPDGKFLTYMAEKFRRGNTEQRL